MSATRPNAEALTEAVARVAAEYEARNPRSKAAFTRARDVMPGGNTRAVLYFDPFPLTFVRGHGGRLIDADDHEYVDYIGEFGAGLYGHSDPVIRAAIREALDEGLSLGGLNRYEVPLAEAIRARFPAMQRIRFANSGTEANLLAMTAARLWTGRAEVAVFSSGYHGGLLSFSGAGLKANVPFPYRYGAFNDVEATSRAFGDKPDSIAAVVIELMMGSGGGIPVDPAFIAYLRDFTRRHGIVLIVDEVVTSRSGASGLQGRLGVEADLTTIGKYFGGGLSFGAVGGRAEIMDVFNMEKGGVGIGGTFNNNTLSLAAGLAGLTKVFTPERAEALFQQGETLRRRIGETAVRRGVPLQAVGAGSVMNLHLQAGELRQPQQATTPPLARKLIHLAMLQRGIGVTRRGYMAMSLPLTTADDERFLAALDDILATHGAALAECVGA